MSVLDQARDIREGEQLDTTVVDQWIRERVPALTGNMRIGQFPGGASNLTYWIGYDNRDFILRRPPFGTKAKSAHDMGREFKVMSALKPLFSRVPEMVAFCDDPAVMGCDFYLMERMVGIIPRANLPRDLSLTPGQTRRMSEAAIDTLADLHSVAWQDTPLAGLGKGEGYVKRQIDGWNQRYIAARTDNVPDGERVMQWLADHQPSQSGVCVIHNDFRMDNLVFSADDPTQVIGVLDWEMATLGDPLMDLGNSLAYWVQADDPAWMQAMRHQPTHLPGMLTRDEVVAHYCARTGRTAGDLTFHRVYGFFRLAVILQQIYYRYHHGQTRDERFAPFHRFVTSLESQAHDLIRQAG